MTRIIWKDEAPFSPEFGDVYFSRDDGLAETNFVFLGGNHLAERWEQTAQDFTIIETGFGTGLNFFAACALWLEKSAPAATLHFISIERYPLTAADIVRALAHWPQLSPFILEFAEQYQPAENGQCTVRLAENRIRLTLLFGDVRDVLPAITDSADAWFLDGFAPSKNPDMWNDTLYSNMQRLTSAGGTFATFTAVGDVRRGLKAHGFNARRVPGFGRKWHMLAGKKPISLSIGP